MKAKNRVIRTATKIQKSVIAHSKMYLINHIHVKVMIKFESKNRVIRTATKIKKQVLASNAMHLHPQFTLCSYTIK